MSKAKTAPAPYVGYLVVISVTNIETGQVVPVSRIQCPDRVGAARLLSEISETREALGELLPGLSAEGYELSEPVVPMVRSFAEAMEASTMSEDVKAYWRREIASGDLLGPA